MVCISSLETLTTDAYLTLGIVGVALVFAIIILSIIRTIYTFVNIFQEYNENDDDMTGEVRKEDYYDSVFTEISQQGTDR